MRIRRSSRWKASRQVRPLEDLRIECGKRHFKNFEQVQFKVVSTLEDLVS